MDNFVVFHYWLRDIISILKLVELSAKGGDNYKLSLIIEFNYEEFKERFYVD